MIERTEREKLELEFISIQYSLLDCIVKQDYKRGQVALKRLVKAFDKLEKLRNPL